MLKRPRENTACINKIITWLAFMHTHFSVAKHCQQKSTLQWMQQRLQELKLLTWKLAHSNYTVGIIMILNFFRLSFPQQTLRAASFKFCHATSCVLLEMRCDTMTKPSLRALGQKVNFCTAQFVPIGTNSPSWKNGLSIDLSLIIQWTHVCIIDFNNIVLNWISQQPSRL